MSAASKKNTTDLRKRHKDYWISLWLSMTQGKYAGMGAVNIGSMAVIPNTATAGFLGDTSFGAWNMFDALQSVVDCLVAVSMFSEHKKNIANKENDQLYSNIRDKMILNMSIASLGLAAGVAMGVMTSLKYVADDTEVFSHIADAARNFKIAAQGLFAVGIILTCITDIVAVCYTFKNTDVNDKALAISKLILSAVSVAASVFSFIGLLPGVGPVFAIAGSAMHMIAASGKQMLSAAADNMSLQNRKLLEGHPHKMSAQKCLSGVFCYAQVALQISSAVILFSLATSGCGLLAVIPVVAVAFVLMIVLSVIKRACEKKWGKTSTVSLVSNAVLLVGNGADSDKEQDDNSTPGH